MSFGISSHLGQPTLVGAKPLHTAPVLMIENPLDSYYQLSSSELQLGTKTVPGVKFSPQRLKHVKSIDAIFTDDNQVSSSALLIPLFLFYSIITFRIY
jgi:hypothetical protein